MLSRDNVQKIYDDFAPRYDRMTAVEGWLFGLNRARREMMSRASGRILDVAAGTGKNLPFLASEQITAIDLSVNMLRFVRHIKPKTATTINIATMDAESLAFADHTFDTVITSLSTCTIPDPVAALREMARVCTANGRILLLEHGRSRYSLINRYLDSHAESYYQSVGCRWNQNPLDIVTRAGLRIVETKRYFLGVFYAIEASVPGT